MRIKASKERARRSRKLPIVTFRHHSAKFSLVKSHPKRMIRGFEEEQGCLTFPPYASRVSVLRYPVLIAWSDVGPALLAVPYIFASRCQITRPRTSVSQHQQDIFTKGNPRRGWHAECNSDRSPIYRISANTELGNDQNPSLCAIHPASEPRGFHVLL